MRLVSPDDCPGARSIAQSPMTFPPTQARSCRTPPFRDTVQKQDSGTPQSKTKHAVLIVANDRTMAAVSYNNQHSKTVIHRYPLERLSSAHRPSMHPGNLCHTASATTDGQLGHDSLRYRRRGSVSSYRATRQHSDCQAAAVRSSDSA